MSHTLVSSSPPLPSPPPFHRRASHSAVATRLHSRSTQPIPRPRTASFLLPSHPSSPPPTPLPDNPLLAYALAKPPASERVPTQEYLIAAHLAPLASQHPSSDYNKVKHGENGAPSHYMPLSITAPAHVRELRARQAVAESAPWYFPPSQFLPLPQAAVDSAATLAPPVDSCAVMRPATPEEVGTAIESLSSDAVAHLIDSGFKPDSDPVVEDIEVPEGILVSRPTSTPPEYPSLPPSLFRYRASHKPMFKRTHTPIRTPPPPSPALAAALAAAMSTRLFVPESTPTPTPCAEGLMQYPWPVQPGSLLPLPVPSQDSQPASIKTSDTHPINISYLVPHELLPLISTHLFPPHVDPQSLTQSNLRPLPPHLRLLPLLACPPPAPFPFARPQLGNFYLSSCPGKKVRLAGPVKGRGAICRDLVTDLQRVREAGVGCIICCLDDDELSFLGAPFQSYESSATALGLALIRIPMPEGLGPLSAQTLYDRLAVVLREYTLRGVHVLAHCRGGVGRAGLVASAWAMMLGLVGGASPGDEERQLSAEAAVDRDLAEAICLVRRRRSVKAIETYEQVRFLRDFLLHLRAR